MNKKFNRLSIIVTIYNDQVNVRPFYDRIKPVMESLEGLGVWEVVFVNDASEDGSLEEIIKLHQEDHRVKLITLSRRFGYHAVVMAGLTSLESDLYAVIDVDCEDPPELLKDFFKAIQGGAHVAYGIRSNRDESSLVILLRKWFYQINRLIADSEVVMWMSEFSMMTKSVRDVILAPRTTFPFIRAELGYVGFKRMGISYRRAKRVYGRSHLNLFRMIQFAVGGFLSSSTFPLRFIAYLSVLLAVGYPLWVIPFHYSRSEASALAMVMMFYFVLISVPLLALYLARTYKNGVARPVFIVDQDSSYL